MSFFMNKVALIQPYWSHDELLPHLYELLSSKYIVDVYLPENMNETRGNIFLDLSMDVNVTWFEPNKRGLQKLRDSINKSEYSSVFLVTFSNYLRRISKPVVRIIHNADEEISRIPEDLDEFKLDISYLALSDFVKDNVRKSLDRNVSLGVFYPFNFNNLTRSVLPSSEKLFITVLGRISSTKSYMSLLQYIKEQYSFFSSKNIVFNIIGSGGNIFDNVKSFIEESNISPVVNLVEPKDAEFVSNSIVFDILKNRTHYLMPLTSNSYYGVKKISATYSWAIAMNIPVIHQLSDYYLYSEIGPGYEMEDYSQVFEKMDLTNLDNYFSYCTTLEKNKKSCIEKNRKFFFSL